MLVCSLRHRDLHPLSNLSTTVCYMLQSFLIDVPCCLSDVFFVSATQCTVHLKCSICSLRFLCLYNLATCVNRVKRHFWRDHSHQVHDLFVDPTLGKLPFPTGRSEIQDDTSATHPNEIYFWQAIKDDVPSETMANLVFPFVNSTNPSLINIWSDEVPTRTYSISFYRIL